jgi:hypothetical protein
MSVVKDIELGQVAQLRSTSQKISQYLHKRLVAYLTTLTPLFAPRRILGEFMQSAFEGKVPGADKNIAEVQEHYKKLIGKPFELPSKLTTPLPAIRNQLEIYPWEYAYQVGQAGSQIITITSPVQWALSYPSGYSLSRLRAARLGKEAQRPEEIKQFIVNALTMHLLVTQSPGIRQIMEDLRFPLSMEEAPELGELPLVVIHSTIPAFRPQDEIIQTVTQLSGTPAFEEIIDVEAIAGLEDPFKQQVAEFIV